MVSDRYGVPAILPEKRGDGWGGMFRGSWRMMRRIVIRKRVRIGPGRKSGCFPRRGGEIEEFVEECCDEALVPPIDFLVW